MITKVFGVLRRVPRRVYQTSVGPVHSRLSGDRDTTASEAELIAAHIAVAGVGTPPAREREALESQEARSVLAWSLADAESE